MKRQTPVLQPKEEETPPVRPLMNSIVNPQGIVPEPISETVKKAETQPEPPQQQAKQPAEVDLTKHPGEAKEKSQDSLLDNRGRSPLIQDEKKQSHVGSERQMQGDLRYTSVMKKNTDMKNNEAAKKVGKISGRADNVLMRMKTVFPFDFFPDTVTIDSNKVSIVDRRFFASESVTSILLEEITDVVIESNFFLAQMVITYSHHPLKPHKYKIPNLHKKEALRAAEIVQGLLVLRISEGIDLSKLRPEDITKELSNIGKAHENLPAL